MKKLPIYFLFTFILFTCSDETTDDSPMVAVCETPTNIHTTILGITEASVSWNDSNANATYSIEYGISGFAQGSGTSINSDLTNIMLTGLDPITTYQVYIKSICSVNNESMTTPAFSFTTLPPRIIPEFLPNLSDLNIFTGDLNTLTPSVYAFEYNLNTPLFTDYAKKQRLVALPEGEKMSVVSGNEDDLPNFPDNTVTAKTFYYNLDDNNASLGKTIIETRVLIKINGQWEAGNYVWNAEQTDAVLDNTTSQVAITYVDSDGDTQNVDYKIPSAQDCITCHQNAGNMIPIGPKLRNLNNNNQLEDLIANNHLENSDLTAITVLPKWNDNSFSLENRARAYMDVNCATCHTAGGYCEFQSTLSLSFETPFANTNIYERRVDIDDRMQSYQPDFSMPYIGTTFIHSEGYNLVRTYLDSL